MAEIWKPVPSLPGVLVSSEGRILLPPSYAPLPNGGYRTYWTVPAFGTVAKANKHARHVYRSMYCKKYGNVKVHRAVCEAFYGPPPFDGAVVIHIDEDGLNNKYDNLKWGTQKENLNAPGFIEYCKSRVSENSPTIKHRMKKAA